MKNINTAQRANIFWKTCMPDICSNHGLICGLPSEFSIQRSRRHIWKGACCSANPFVRVFRLRKWEKLIVLIARAFQTSSGARRVRPQDHKWLLLNTDADKRFAFANSRLDLQLTRTLEQLDREHKYHLSVVESNKRYFERKLENLKRKKHQLKEADSKRQLEHRTLFSHSRSGKSQFGSDVEQLDSSISSANLTGELRKSLSAPAIDVMSRPSRYRIRAETVGAPSSGHNTCVPHQRKLSVPDPREMYRWDVTSELSGEDLIWKWKIALCFRRSWYSYKLINFCLLELNKRQSVLSIVVSKTCDFFHSI